MLRRDVTKQRSFFSTASQNIIMMRIVPNTSPQGAKKYFDDGLSKTEGYYNEAKIPGIWHGIAAERLGLHGEVNRADFHALCDNINPDTGERLTPRTKAGRRVAYDMTENVPKSVSALLALTNDEALKAEIISEYHASGDKVMTLIERGAATRVRKGQDYETRGSHDRKTGNLVWAKFTHFEGRPVNGIPDPQLHSHYFIFNVTFDERERRFKAAQFGDIKADMPYYEALFHAEFAGRLAKMGLQIKRTEKRWEIAGVPQSVLEKFSRRTQEIENKAAEIEKKEGRPLSAKEKSELGALTRAKKNQSLTPEQLRSEWHSRLTPEERKAIEAIKIRDDKSSSSDGITPKQALDYAIAHSFERRSAVTKRQLMTEALKYGVGPVSPEEIEKQLTERPGMISAHYQGKEFVSTEQVLAEEKKMIALARDGRGTCSPLRSDRQMGEYQFKNERFHDPKADTQEQKRVINAVLNSFDKIQLIQGRAGTGKTTLMSEIASGIEEGDKKMFAFTVTGQGAEMLRKDGFANAQTVARLKTDKELQARLKNQVIWIDESGLLGNKDMRAVFDVAEKQGARVILSGDTRQHHSVPRGDAQRLLETYAGMQSHSLNQIHRQKEQQYKQAVSEISEGRAAKGFDTLDKMGAIREIAGEKRYEQLADDYLQAVKDKKSALIISPTHREGEDVTALIRDKLREENHIGKEERTYTRIQNLNWTLAQRGDAKMYRQGQVIAFHQNAKGGFVKSQRFTVVGHDKEGVRMQAQDGTIRAVPIGQAARFSVYEQKSLALALGDKIRLTQGGRSLTSTRLNNGAIYEVKGFTENGDIRLSAGRRETVISKNYAHLNYGYCATSHASQGKTVARVFIAQDSRSYGSKEQFYVSVSRARESAVVYTDNKQDLRERVAQSGQRISAIELQQQRYKERLARQRDFERVYDYYQSNRREEKTLRKDFNQARQKQEPSQTIAQPPQPQKEQPQRYPRHSDSRKTGPEMEV